MKDAFWVLLILLVAGYFYVNADRGVSDGQGGSKQRNPVLERAIQ